MMALHWITHWGRVTHICVVKLTTIGSDNGLLPKRRQAIIWTNAGILLIGPLGTNFSEILIWIQTFSFKKMHLKMPSAKWCPICLGLNMIRTKPLPMMTKICDGITRLWWVKIGSLKIRIIDWEIRKLEFLATSWDYFFFIIILCPDFIFKSNVIIINSVWPNDTISQHKSGSTLAQVKVCYQKTQSNYLNQCWLILHVYFQLRPIAQEVCKISIHKMSLKNTLIKCTSSFMGQSFDAIWSCNNMVIFLKYSQYTSHILSP